LNLEYWQTNRSWMTSKSSLRRGKRKRKKRKKRKEERRRRNDGISSSILSKSLLHQKNIKNHIL
jgi:hypothetical protein